MEFLWRLTSSFLNSSHTDRSLIKFIYGILVIISCSEVRSGVCCAVVSRVAHLTHNGKYTIYTYAYTYIYMPKLVMGR